MKRTTQKIELFAKVVAIRIEEKTSLLKKSRILQTIKQKMLITKTLVFQHMKTTAMFL